MLWRVPLVIFDYSAESPRNPPENKACISINQHVMKVFGLRKKKLARGYSVHVLHIGDGQIKANKNKCKM